MTATAENIDTVREMMRADITDLLVRNTGTIMQELVETPDGKLGVSISCKLTATKGRVYNAAAISFSRKFNDDAESSVEVDDPDQPRLAIDQAAKDFVATCKKSGAKVEIKTKE